MTAAFHTLGCKTNAYETQAIQEQFQAAGYEIGEFTQTCDVYVINTCAVTQEAARKSRQMIGRCKRRNPQALVVVTGCYAQEARERLLLESMADLVVGNNEKSRIADLVSRRFQERFPEAGIHVEDLTHCTVFEAQQITRQTDHVRAYVKIQDGCNRFCSYCVIPYLRGRSRSRSVTDILQESRALAAAGYQELVLTGIDISSFADPGLKQSAEKTSDTLTEITDEGMPLVELIGQLAEIPGIRRIRLGSLEAGIISDPLIRKLCGISSFCPQFHLSLQSGCDSVLKRMNRHYTTDQYEKAVAIIRKHLPEAAITTDVITGFPGETEEEFEQTMEFAERIAFSRMHVFPYSRRKGTRADLMPGQLSKAVKEERARRLIQKAELLRRAYEEQQIGRVCRILVEDVVSRDGQHFLAGYTPEYVYILVRLSDPMEKPDRDAVVNQMLDVVPQVFQNGELIAFPAPGTEN